MAIRSLSINTKRGFGISSEASAFSNGGVERIRTSAPVTQPNDLAISSYDCQVVFIVYRVYFCLFYKAYKTGRVSGLF